MCRTYVNTECIIILRLAVILVALNAVVAAPQFLSALNDRRPHRHDQEEDRGNSRQQMPFGNNRPGQQIIDRIRSNINTNLENLGSNIGHAIHNTYGLLQNLNNLSMGRRTTLRPTFSANTHSGFTERTNNYRSTSPVNPGDDNNIDHYIDGKFPVILLRNTEIRK